MELSNFFVSYYRYKIEIQLLFLLFRNNKKLFYDYLDFIQIVSAYCQISDPQSSKQIEFDKLISYVKVNKKLYIIYFKLWWIELFINKVLNQNILDKDGPSVLSRVYALFSEKVERTEENKNLANYSISDLIILLIYVYSLIGEECYYGIEEEHRIKVSNLKHFSIVFYI